MEKKIKVVICDVMRMPYITNISPAETNLKKHFGGDFVTFANDYGNDSNVVTIAGLEAPNCHTNKAAGCKVSGKAIIARLSRTGKVEGLKDDEAKKIYYDAKCRWNT